VDHRVAAAIDWEVATIGADGTETTAGPVFTSSDSGPISQYGGSASSPPANGIP